MAVISALFQSSKTPETIDDSEFGRIVLKRNARARYVRLRMGDDGALVVTLPRFAAIKNAYELIESSRSQIRGWRQKHAKKTTVLNNGDRIGQSHTIHFLPSSRGVIRVTVRELALNVEYPETLFHTDPKVQKAIRPHIQKALQKEARAYLPRRLKYLSDQYGFQYDRIRYGTQKGRWGSCSSSGTISLNVGLMLVEPGLIDYVLVHELCHTKHMNHSQDFWELVESHIPDYKQRRKVLKTKNPTL